MRIYQQVASHVILINIRYSIVYIVYWHTCISNVTLNFLFQLGYTYFIMSNKKITIPYHTIPYIYVLIYCVVYSYVYECIFLPFFNNLLQQKAHWTSMNCVKLESSQRSSVVVCVKALICLEMYSLSEPYTQFYYLDLLFTKDKLICDCEICGKNK